MHPARHFPAAYAVCLHPASLLVARRLATRDAPQPESSAAATSEGGETSGEAPSQGDSQGAAASVDSVVREVKENSAFRTEDLLIGAIGLTGVMERQQQLELSKMLAAHRLSMREHMEGKYVGTTISEALQGSVQKQA